MKAQWGWKNVLGIVIGTWGGLSVLPQAVSWAVPQAYAVGECREVQIPNRMDQVQVSKVSSPLYPGSRSLYRFEYAFDGKCGYGSKTSRYPTSKVIQNLIHDFYRGKVSSPGVAEAHDPAQKPFAKNRYSFKAMQSLFGNRFSYESKVDLVDAQKFIWMEHSSSAAAPFIRAEAPYSGLRDIQWKTECQQESAGWCFAWKASFAILWEAQENLPIEQVKESVIKTVLPSVFQETFLKHASFLSAAAN